MQVIQIPPPPPPPPESPEQRELFEARHWETAYRRFDPDDVPHLLIQLQDDLARTRQREALWLSVILHFLVIILLWNSEKLLAFLPHRPYVVTAVPSQQKDATYLALPPDEQKITRRPDAKVLSDKDRIATSKAPRLNRDELKKIIDASRAGRPGQSLPQQSPAVAQAQQHPQPSPQQNPAPVTPPAQNNQTAQLQMPPTGRKAPTTPSFSTPMTAGSAIEQAAAASRGHYGGEGGDYGLNQGHSPQVMGPAEIITDTQGVDFGPYLARVVMIVKENWYRIIPESAMPPIMKKGKLGIRFVILKDGKVSAMVLEDTSGDVALDRAAWSAITLSNPFPRLPKDFPGQDIGLRFRFYYNPDKADLQ